MAVQVFPGIPFFEDMEFIFILHAPAKVAAQASLLCPYGTDQGSDRLRQLHALLGKNLHSYDDQDHTDGRCKWPANNGRRKGSYNYIIDNGRLDEWQRNVEKGETVVLASVYGGNSIY
jgi:hypothetical protein